MGQRLPQPEQQQRGNPEGPREVLRVARSATQVEGAGFEVHRPFPQHGLQQVDPFLLLDELGPRQLAPGEAQGAPDHPHRGFETVTYLLEGELEHRDSRGHHGLLGPGDVQWMTAGDGVVHSEMPSRALQERGGRLHGFQLWVNLPKADKRMRPRYQEIKAASLPVAKSADGQVSVKVLAGEALGAKAVIDTRTPIFYLHLELQPGARFSQPVPAGFAAFAFVVRGEGIFGPAGAKARRTDVALFDKVGKEVLLQAPEGGEGLEVLLIGGRPLGEPVARYGPFVMNTDAEVFEAIRELEEGRFGSIPPQIG
jgi:quercetin 2,3-dioxygenase